MGPDREGGKDAAIHVRLCVCVKRRILLLCSTNLVNTFSKCTHVPSIVTGAIVEFSFRTIHTEISYKII